MYLQLLFLMVLLIVGASATARAETLLDFNDLQKDHRGFVVPKGWSLSRDVTGYDAPGMRISGVDPNLGKNASTNKIPNTGMFDKTDYGKGNLLAIVTDEVAPGTEGGAAFLKSNSLDNQISWWVWYDSFPLEKRGVTNAETDRMSFYIKLDGSKPMVGPKGGSNYGFHVGTYICAITKSGCPYEGPGNQHYYHYLGLNPGAWIHVELDQQPQHLRNHGRPKLNNPVAVAPEVFTGYFANMHQLYMEIRKAQLEPTKMWLDEVRFRSTKDSQEPDQNEQSITSVWLGYWSEVDRWQISWSDEWQGRGANAFSTFVVRYSTAPITNENFHLATLVKPLHFTGPEYESSKHKNAIRRLDSYNGIVWTAFELPDQVEMEGRPLYFAIKDVSVAGGNAGGRYPYNRTDGKGAPSDFIRTISYMIPGR